MSLGRNQKHAPAPELGDLIVERTRHQRDSRRGKKA